LRAYCAPQRSYVSFGYVSYRSEDDTELLLYVLSLCVFWRGEAEQLA